MNICSPLIFSSLLALSIPAAACNPARPENFSAFFTNFSSDKTFATNRTLYPSMRIRYEYSLEDGKQQIIETRRQVSMQEDMKYLPLQEYVKAYGLKLAPPEITSTHAVAAVSNTGWLLEYHFSLRQGCWFLHEIQQHLL